MGRRGPAPKPTPLKLASGNAGKRPINDAEPDPPRGAPPVPEFLDDKARAIWDQLVPLMVESGMVRKIDGFAMGRYCQYLILWGAALAFLRKHGEQYPVCGAPTKKHPKGRILGWREFPLCAKLLRYEQRLIQLERELGLTPSARTRIRAELDRAVAADPDKAANDWWGDTA
jgi:P27 family predicted phage terminase small subunit